MSHIRLANCSDARALTNLRYSFRSTSDKDVEAETTFLSRCTAWMSERLQQNNWRCWVVEKDNSIFGALWLQLIEKIPNPTSEPEFHAYITNVFVEESARGAGLGSRLLAEALAFCKQQSVHAVILWPTEKSRTLYERHGFAVRPDLLELLIDDPASS
jgi:GNAT superfamily N-acetyltransferase